MWPPRANYWVDVDVRRTHTSIFGIHDSRHHLPYEGYDHGNAEMDIRIKLVEPCQQTNLQEANANTVTKLLGDTVHGLHEGDHAQPRDTFKKASCITRPSPELARQVLARRGRLPTWTGSSALQKDPQWLVIPVIPIPKSRTKRTHLSSRSHKRGRKMA